MNNYGFTFHHFGLAAKTPERAVAFLQSLGYQIGVSVRDDLQQVNLIFCQNSSMPAVEIITPVDGTPGPLTTYLESSNGVIYHLCYECANREQALTRMESDQHRVRCISEPKPAILFNGAKVSFYRVQGFGMIEILEPTANV